VDIAIGLFLKVKIGPAGYLGQASAVTAIDLGLVAIAIGTIRGC